MYTGFITKDMVHYICKNICENDVEHFEEYINKCHKDYASLHPFQLEILKNTKYTGSPDTTPIHYWKVKNSGVELEVTWENHGGI